MTMPQTDGFERVPTARYPFHVMTKPSGSDCNLACSYCFYLEKEALYPETRGMRMSEAILERYVRDQIAAQPGSSVNFAWQGGEPTLMGLEFFRKAVELQRRHAQGKHITNAFQSNGILLNDAWGRFFKDNEFLVGVSIDGPKALHDGFRVNKGGRGTFEQVMAGIQVLKEHGVEFNTLTCVHRKNAQHPVEVYQFLREAGSGYIQFIPIVERAAGQDARELGLQLASPPDLSDPAAIDKHVTPWSVRPLQYGTFLVRVFDEWVRNDVGSVFVQQFDTSLANWLGEPAGLCIFSEFCGRGLAMEHNGDVYSCDHYVYPEHRLGNIVETPLADMVDSPRQWAFGKAKSDTLPRYCRECPFRFACHGGCPKYRFLRSPTGEPGLNYLCAGYKRYFAHVKPAMRKMALLLRKGQPASDIMDLPQPARA